MDAMVLSFIRHLQINAPDSLPQRRQRTTATTAWVSSLLCLSRRIHDIALPALYETVILTKANRDPIARARSKLFRTPTKRLVTGGQLACILHDRKQLSAILRRFCHVSSFCGEAKEFYLFARTIMSFTPRIVVLTSPGVPLVDLVRINRSQQTNELERPTLFRTTHLHMFLHGDTRRDKPFSLLLQEVALSRLEYISIAYGGERPRGRAIAFFCEVVVRDAPTIFAIPTLRRLVVRIPLCAISHADTLEIYARTHEETRLFVDEVDWFGNEMSAATNRHHVEFIARHSSHTLTSTPPSPVGSAFQHMLEEYPRSVFDPDLWMSGRALYVAPALNNA